MIIIDEYNIDGKGSADRGEYASRILEIALLSGILVLESGGETYRAEETVNRICGAGGFPESEVIAQPTGVFLSLVRCDAGACRETLTAVERIKKRSIDLLKLERTNSAARKFVSGEADDIETLETLRILSRPPDKSASGKLRSLRSGGIAALSIFFFTLLYSGSALDAVIAAAAGFVVQLLASLLSRADIYNFMLSLLGGAVIALFAVAADTICLRLGFTGLNIDRVIVGGIIPLLPGLAMTNAIRDTMTGDLVSGTARFAEVLLTAVAIAGGVGAVLTLYIMLGGKV